MSPKTPPYPHEKRVQRYGYVALAATTLTGIVLALVVDARLLGLALPGYVPLALLLAGAALGAFAVARRSSPSSLGAAALLVLGVIPAADARPGIGTYALGLVFGLALLLTLELVHMTERYERAHRAVENDNVPEEHINQVTDEALRTLGARGGIAALCAAGAIGLAFLLAAIGPAQWRAAVETSAPLGVAVLALALAGGASLFILARGATFRLRRDPPQKELLPDVAE